ncbi:unnamed protein product [Chrysoparadoxa australica]
MILDDFVEAGEVAYANYDPAKLTIGAEHPDPVVENATLATVVPPDIDYEVDLPDEVINEGKLSKVQVGM